MGYLTGYQMDVVELADWAHANGMYNVTGADGTYRTSFYPAASNRYGGTYGFTIDCGSGSGYWSTASDARLKNHLIAGGTAIVHVSNHFICLVGYDTSTGKYHLYESAPDPYRGTNYNGGDVWFTEAQLCSGYTDVDWFCLISATSGWKQDSTGWWYQYADGSYATGWAQIGSNWYYFNQNGYMLTGWQEIGGAWYYLEPGKGYMRTGWVYSGDYYYYLDSSGKMLTGWQEIEGNWYYLNSSDDSMPKGAMYTGWKEINGYWYYFNTPNDGTSSIMQTGWIQLDGKWYFLESSGKMLTGWRFINSKWYHLDEESGVMSTSDWIYDEDAWYYVGTDGAMIDGAEWNGVFEDGLDIGTDFYATIDIPKTGTRVGVDSDSNNVEVQAVRDEDASDYNEQLWYFERRADDGSYRITNVATGLCMDQVDGHIDAGTNVRVYSGNDAMAQRWFVFANGDTHGLVSACSAWNMTVLDVMDNLGTEGTNIRIWTKNTSTAQQFAITPVVCRHNWSDGYCPDCGEYCQHSYENGICSVCGMNCPHSYESVVTAPTCTTAGYTTPTCKSCGHSTQSTPTSALGHTYENGQCIRCGAADPTFVPDYYLIGYINGADYGCEEDYENMGDYKFVNGNLVATFQSDSYVFLKTSGNADWFMTNSYCTDTTGTFYDTDTGAGEKMFVPGGVEITFTLVENADGSVTVSYTTAAASVVPTLKQEFPTLTFEDVISMNVYVSAQNADDVVDMGLMMFDSKLTSFSISDAKTVVPGYSWSTTYNMYVVSTGAIAAKDMGDTVNFATYAKLTDGTYAYSTMVSYSPANYAYSLLNTGNQATKNLMVAMLNYGAEAQTFFNYRTDALMNAKLTSAQKASIETYRADMMASVSSVSAAKAANFTKTSTGFTSYYPSISFEGAFKINYYCVPSATVQGNITLYYWNQADFDANSVLKTSNATGTIAMTKGTDRYEAAVSGIAAKDLDKGVYVAFVYSDGTTTYSSGVLGYSIGNYCVTKAAGTGTTANLAKATAVYGYYANELFNK